MRRPTFDPDRKVPTVTFSKRGIPAGQQHSVSSARAWVFIDINVESLHRESSRRVPTIRNRGFEREGEIKVGAITRDLKRGQIKIASFENAVFRICVAARSKIIAFGVLNQQQAGYWLKTKVLNPQWGRLIEWNHLVSNE